MFSAMDRLQELEEQLEYFHSLEESRKLTTEEWNDFVDLNELRAEWLRQCASKRARDVGTSLATPQKKQKTDNGNQLWHVRISCVGLKLDDVHAFMQKMSTRFWIVKTAEFAYVLEQSGIDESSRGYNPHVHVRLRSTLTTSGRLAKEVKRVTKLPDEAVECIKHDNINALKNYMSGNKGPDKVLGVQQDKIWRMETGLKMIYIVKNNVQS